MRLPLPLTPLLLAALTSATSSSSSSSSPSSSSSEKAASTPFVEPTPVGQLWTATWDAKSLLPYTQHCRNKNIYEAKIYKLDELYPDLKDNAPQLKIFYNKQLYAGSWGGIDVHG